ncbi:hypothetical protein F4819DRAFT_507534 [Hypoxylon fuscum]|nr:hypothetical protein F4819DRAFT_507534 [Hypoxylon fuscum]
MYGNVLSTFTLLALGSLFGTSVANIRWKVTAYEDIGCDDFLGTSSSPDPSGCVNFHHSVPVRSLLAEGTNGRCGWMYYAYAGPDCDGAKYAWINLIDGQCARLSDSGEWKSYEVVPNPC